MMAGYSDSRSFAQRFILVMFLTVLHVTAKKCDLNKCQGPLRYYKDLGCEPIYKNSSDCCPESYNCDHLKKLAKDKCYMNGHEYNDDEALRSEDRNRCDVGCTCSAKPPNDPVFNCAIVDCYRGDPEGTCYLRGSPDLCCGKIICLGEGEVRPTCKVDGKIYQDGEIVHPKADPEVECFCQPGFTGKIEEPYCKKPNRSQCSPFLRDMSNVNNKCAPVYTNKQNLVTECPGWFPTYRCEEEGDVIIRNNSSSSDGGKMCKLGNLKMHKGDILKPGNSDDSSNVKCVCQVPPIPTCRLIKDPN
ncbi:kielin/chordin-like protein [Megachile rotundata]|uniref:kielin/chordin-like protein n=1 Tax=Megachile rotundata TaxID=143995 RepID=UPI003FD2AAB4